MNILLVNTFYYPNMVGGAEHSVKLLAEHLAAEGHCVWVYTLDSSNKSSCIDIINGVTVYRGYNLFFSLQKHRNPKNLLEKILCRAVSFYNFSIKKDLYYIYSKFNPDVIHCNNLYGISVYIWKYFQKKRKKVIYTIRDYFLLDPRAEIGGSNTIILSIYQKVYCYFSNKYVDIVTAPSAFTLNAFSQSGYFQRSEKECIVNSVALNLQFVSEIVEKKINYSNNETVFLFVGALSHKKGLDNLLEAFNQVTMTTISLIICGSGELEAKVLEYERKDNRIKYKGQLTSEQLEDEYTAADVLIAPSIWDEPFGRIIIEGNQYGLAVIGSDRAGIAETLDVMQSGEKINPNSIEDLRNAIIRFSKHDYYIGYLKKIPNNIKEYDIKTQVSKFLRLYNA